MSTPALPTMRPPAWTVLADALTQRRPVRIAYHGQQRVVCPHTLGWHNGRAKVLCYQDGGTTSAGALPDHPAQRWRTLFIDQIHDPTIIDGPWATAHNYNGRSNGIDQVELAIQPSTP